MRKKDIRALVISLVIGMVCLVAIACAGKNTSKSENTDVTAVSTETITVAQNTSIEETVTNEVISQNSETVTDSNTSASEVSLYDSFDWSSIPDYSGEASIIINNDVPLFTEEEKVFKGTYIKLSELDSLGRCGVAMGVLGQETEPTEERGDISSVHPTGWKQLQLSDGTYLYNRCHLLMYALSGLNDDERNLITGTRQFNADTTGKGMLSFESMALSVVDNMNAHVVYRVTPVFEGDNLLAKGVLMECYCIEYPEDCTYCRFIFDCQEGVNLDYSTGEAVEQ